HDVRQIQLLQGTAYETPAFFFESNQPQPAILIIGGTHGNEPAGYEAALRLLDRFQKSPPSQGKIIIIPLANRVAVEKFERRIAVPAGVDREKGNLNRCYPGNPEGFPMEQLAYQIQQIAIDNSVGVFIDLHEARRPHLETDTEGDEKGLGQTIIYHPNEPSTWLVMQMLDRINSLISDPDKHFSSLERPIKNSASWWAGKYLDIAAFTFETPRNLPIEERIKYQLLLVDVVLEDRAIQ
ncbi:MAG: succinylglutamate desuccinylase/aspartoacylase family protein, partial [bacterium]